MIDFILKGSALLPGKERRTVNSGWRGGEEKTILMPRQKPTTGLDPRSRKEEKAYLWKDVKKKRKKRKERGLSSLLAIAVNRDGE